MSTVRTWRTTSTSSDETSRIAEAVGRELRGGECLELISDLGGGKTTFVRGLAKGAGSSDPVSSPSFTLTNQYRTDGLTIYHFDFYRLQEPGIMRDELSEALEDDKGVVVVEWAGVVDDVLPADRLTVRILPAAEETGRRIEFSCTDKSRHLVPVNT